MIYTFGQTTINTETGILNCAGVNFTIADLEVDVDVDGHYLFGPSWEELVAA